MNDSGIWTRGFTYGATLVVTPFLIWILTRAFPARRSSFHEFDTLRLRYAATETWSAVSGIAAMWAALALMLIAGVGNTPWLLGVGFGWLILAPMVVIALRTLPNGVSCWREFWRYHELNSRISLRLLAPIYAVGSILGILSTAVILSRE